MLTILENLKDRLEPREISDFNRRIASLNSNIVYWNKQLSIDRTEAQFELNRCRGFLTKIAKELKKIEDKGI